MRYKDPHTWEKWLATSTERGADAAKLREATRNVGALYMIGYILETKMKALIAAKKKKAPMTHDLMSLWEACGFKQSDIKGKKRCFFDCWCVSLRYQWEWPASQLDPGLDFDTIYSGGMEVAQYLQKCIRYIN